MAVDMAIWAFIGALGMLVLLAAVALGVSLRERYQAGAEERQRKKLARALERERRRREEIRRWKAYELQRREAEERRQQEAAKAAGDRGEALAGMTLEPFLKQDDYLFRNLQLERDGKRAECDFVVVNSHGVRILEVKNYKGKLYGDAGDYDWQKVKAGYNGEFFTKGVKNPIHQVKREIWFLKEYLLDCGIRIWVDGYVYLLSGDTDLDDPMLLRRAHEVEQAIHAPGKRSLTRAEVSAVVRALGQLEQREF